MKDLTDENKIIPVSQVIYEEVSLLEDNSAIGGKHFTGNFDGFRHIEEGNSHPFSGQLRRVGARPSPQIERSLYPFKINGLDDFFCFKHCDVIHSTDK